jgi:hypothetical protein
VGGPSASTCPAKKNMAVASRADCKTFFIIIPPLLNVGL